MFELIIHFHMQDTITMVTDDPAHMLRGIKMGLVSRIEINSLEPATARKPVPVPDFPSYCNTCGATGGRHTYHCNNDR